MPEFPAKSVTWEDMEVGSEISTIHCYVTPTDIEAAADLSSGGLSGCNYWTRRR